MLKIMWTEILPGGSFEGGVNLISDLKWNLEIREKDDSWVVNAGHKTLLKTTSREAVDAFLYGMALAYAAIPEKILSQFRQYAQESAS